MSFFSGVPFFTLMTLLLLPALFLGLRGKAIGPYGLFASLVMILAVLAGTPLQLAWLGAYLLWESLLVYLYIPLRQKKGPVPWHYALALFLSLIPLLLMKWSEVTTLSLFSFLGLSYLTFRVAQIIIETYDGVISSLSLPAFWAFLLFFPTFSAGPIDRSRRFEEDFRRRYTREEYLILLGDGLEQLLIGLVYKFVLSALAFRLLSLCQPKGGLLLALAYGWCYGIYMFFDFAGYSRMAVGCAYILGVRTPGNFHLPFLSRDMKDFWNRWHITLSHWFRDYLFSRFLMGGIKGKWFKSRLSGACWAFLLNMLVMGAWHGLTLYYLLYGLYHGVLLAATEVYQKKCSFYKKYRNCTWYGLLSWFVTLNLVMVGFLIFSGALFT